MSSSLERWVFSNRESPPLFFKFFVLDICFCIQLVRLPSWSDTACSVWWHLSISVLISELCFMNVKQVQERLIKVSLGQLSLCCQLEAALHFFFLLKCVGAFYSDIFVNLLNGAQRNSPFSLLLLAVNLKKRGNNSFSQKLPFFVMVLYGIRSLLKCLRLLPSPVTSPTDFQHLLV